MIIRTMNDLSDKDRREVLGEVLADQLQAILVYVKDIPKMKQDIRGLKDDMSDVKSLLQMHEVDIMYLRKKIA